MSHASGKLVILVMAGLAVAGASAGVWYHYQTGHRTVEFWGREAAVLIAGAPQAEVLRIAPADEVQGQSPDEILRLAGVKWAVVERRDVMAARGFSNVRRGLVQDFYFDWSASPPSAPYWRRAIRFRAGDRTATVLLTSDARTVGLAETGARVMLDVDSAGIVQAFLSENLARE